MLSEKSRSHRILTTSTLENIIGFSRKVNSTAFTDIFVKFYRGRSGKTESVLSISLLAALILIGLGVLLKQAYYNIEDYGIIAGAGGVAGQVQEMEASGKASLELPEPAGYQGLSKMKIYTSENLYEKIDGKAPFYLDSGFQRLLTRRFVSSQNNEHSMEVYLYDMGGHRNAFSVYSRQKRSGAHFLSDIPFAYKTGNAVYLVAGKFYVEIVGTAEAPALAQAMRTFGKHIYNTWDGSGNEGLSELSLFPETNLVPHSFEFYVADAFGFSGLNNTFTAEYQVKGKSVTAFFSKRAGIEQARQLLEEYAKFLTSTGGSHKEIHNQKLKEKGCRIIDVYGAYEIIFLKGVFVAGVHDVLRQAPAEKVALELMNSLERRGSKNDDPR